MDGIGCGDLIIPKIRCYLYVNAPIYFFILLESSSIYTRFIGGKVEFLNNYYGFHQGNGSNQHKQNEKLFNFAESDGFSTQKELSESYGITQQTMNNYMKMANMIPELEDLVDTGIVTKPFTPKYPSKRYW